MPMRIFDREHFFTVKDKFLNSLNGALYDMAEGMSGAAGEERAGFTRAAGIMDRFLANSLVKRLAVILPKPVKIMFVLKQSYERQGGGDQGLRGIASDLFEKTRLLGDFIQAYVKGEYREVEPYKIALTFLAIAYFISPLDIIPDAIPVIGFMDDILIMTWLIRNLDEELEKFRRWQQASLVVV